MVCCCTQPPMGSLPAPTPVSDAKSGRLCLALPASATAVQAPTPPQGGGFLEGKGLLGPDGVGPGASPARACWSRASAKHVAGPALGALGDGGGRVGGTTRTLQAVTICLVP